MKIIDYNGTEYWSVESVRERYVAYAKRFQVASPLALKPTEYEEGPRHWIYPIMWQVIEGIDRGDKACIEIGVEFIESDLSFPFGKTNKSNTARALRRAVLNSYHIERIRKRVVQMLIAECVSREYREYAKLLRKVGLGDWWPEIEAKANRNNPYVLRYYNYFHQCLSGR